MSAASEALQHVAGLLVLLESLSPEQRAAFQLREVFDEPYDRIAEGQVAKTPAKVNFSSAQGDPTRTRPRRQQARSPRVRQGTQPRRWLRVRPPGQAAPASARGSWHAERRPGGCALWPAPATRASSPAPPRPPPAARARLRSPRRAPLPEAQRQEPVTWIGEHGEPVEERCGPGERFALSTCRETNHGRPWGGEQNIRDRTRGAHDATQPHPEPR